LEDVKVIAFCFNQVCNEIRNVRRNEDLAKELKRERSKIKSQEGNELIKSFGES
jgi:hypothetical protein